MTAGKNVLFFWSCLSFLLTKPQVIKQGENWKSRDQQNLRPCDYHQSCKNNLKENLSISSHQMETIVFIPVKGGQGWGTCYDVGGYVPPGFPSLEPVLRRISIHNDTLLYKFSKYSIACCFEKLFSFLVGLYIQI